MKKIVILLTMLTLISMIFAQINPALLNEGFEGSTFPPDGWKVGPNSSTGTNGNWYRSTADAISGTATAVSRSWATNALFPDNWLVTKAVELPAANSHYYYITYNIRQSYSSPGLTEKYTLYITTKDPNDDVVEAFTGEGVTVIVSENLPEHELTTSKAFPLRAYEGKVWFAFRHHDCSDVEKLILDDVKVVHPGQKDMRILSKKIPSYIPTGTAITLSATIDNWGLDVVESEDYTLNLMNGNEIFKTLDNVSFNPAETKVLSYTTTTTELVSGKMYNFWFDLVYVGDDDIANNITAPIWVCPINTTSPVGLIDINQDNTSTGWPTTTANTANVPFNYGSYNSVTQTIYKTSELGGSGLITHIQYRLVSNLVATHHPLQGINLWFAQVGSKENFTSTTDYVLLDKFTEVLKVIPNSQTPNNPTFTSGTTARNIWIALDRPFYYDETKGNLVVMAFKEFMGMAGQNTNWQTKTGSSSNVGANRVIRRDSSTNYVIPENYSNGAGTLASSVAVTRFVKHGGDITLTGTVTFASEPVNEVKVSINGFPTNVATGSDGKYIIRGFNGTTNTGITFDGVGYNVFSTPELLADTGEGSPTPGLTVTDDTNWVYDHVLTEAPKAKVTAVVKTGWDDSVLENQVIKFIHPRGNVYTTITESDGTIPSSFSGLTIPSSGILVYTMIIEKENYQPYTREVIVQFTDTAGTILNLGTIYLVEQYKAPIALRAKVDDGDAILTWFEPLTPSKTMTWQLRDAEGALGNDSSANGGILVHRYDAADIATAGIGDHGIHRISFQTGNTGTTYRYLYVQVYRTLAPVTDLASIAPDGYPGPVYEQEVPVSSITPGQVWHHIDLDEIIPVKLDGSIDGELWIAIDYIADIGYSAAMDYSGREPHGKANVHNWAFNGWNTMESINAALTSHKWCIAAHTVKLPTTKNSASFENLQTPQRAILSGGIISDATLMDNGIQAGPVQWSFNNFEKTRARTNYELYSAGLTDIGSPSKWKTVSNTLTNQETFTHTLMNDVPTSEPFRYILVANYNKAQTGIYKQNSAATYSNQLSKKSQKVTITVTDSEATPKPIVGALVRFTNEKFSTVQFSGETDNDGRIEFTGVGVGTYTLAITASGYAPKKIEKILVDDEAVVVPTVKLEVQAVIFFESFEGSTFPPTGWLNISLDNDYKGLDEDDNPLSLPYDWIHGGVIQAPTPPHGSRVATSESFCPNEELCLYPDNWLITPSITLPKTEGAEYTLTFESNAAGRMKDEETFVVYMLETPVTDKASLIAMLGPNTPYVSTWPEWAYGDLLETAGVTVEDVTLSGRGWNTHTYEIPETVQGKTIQFAFRHWHSKDNLYLNIDDIRVYTNIFEITDLKGKVVDFDSASPKTPIEGATVSMAGGSSTTTNSTGEFVFNQQVEGFPITLTVTKTGYQTLTFNTNIPVGGMLADIQLKKFWMVTGKLLDVTTAIPNRKVRVLAGETLIEEATTTSDGSFTFNAVPTGSYSFATTKDDKSVSTTFKVEGKDTDLGNIDINTLGVEDEVIIAPTETTLKGNYPNPFNPVTTVAFDMAKDGMVKVEIFNVKGQKVKTLVNDYRMAGRYTVNWNGVDEVGNSVSSGIYFYRMQTKGFSSSKKMLLLK